MRKTGRWGETPPKVIQVTDAPGQWADASLGVLIDWSGITAVLVCLHPKCNEAFGPILSLDDVTEACANHRDVAHVEFNSLKQRITPVPPEARARANRIQETCLDCCRPRKTVKGRCAACRYAAQLSFAIELKYLPANANMKDLTRWKEAQRLGVEYVATGSIKATTPRVSRGIKHGKLHTFQEHKCRCALCLEAYEAFYAARRAENPRSPGAPRKYGAPVPLTGTRTHGTWNAYNKNGCRCEPCSDEASRYRKQAREARLAKQ